MQLKKMMVEDQRMMVNALSSSSGSYDGQLVHKMKQGGKAFGLSTLILKVVLMALIRKVFPEIFNLVEKTG